MHGRHIDRVCQQANHAPRPKITLTCRQVPQPDTARSGVGMSRDQLRIADCLEQVFEAIERIARYSDNVDEAGFSTMS